MNQFLCFIFLFSSNEIYWHIDYNAIVVESKLNMCFVYSIALLNSWEKKMQSHLVMSRENKYTKFKIEKTKIVLCNQNAAFRIFVSQWRKQKPGNMCLCLVCVYVHFIKTYEWKSYIIFYRIHPHLLWSYLHAEHFQWIWCS